MLRIKKPLKRLSVFLLLQVSITFLWAQGQAPQLPKIIPPSPEAAAFQRYGEIPLDYSTGVPKIEIPLYTVKSRKLEVPISLSYHASGIQVNDLSTPQGLGWVMNAGGIVTRTVIDHPDDKVAKTVYKTTAEKEAACSGPVTAQLIGSLGPLLEYNYYDMDKQSDRFYYQLTSGKSGAFRFNFLNNEIVKVPYSPVNIVKKMSNETSPTISGFEITDDSGVLYEFNTAERCYTLSNNPRRYASAWYLTSIISADKTDTIRFTYHTFANEYHHFIYTNSIEWHDVSLDFLLCNLASNALLPASFSSGGSDDQAGCTPLLASIISATTTVNFNYTNGRQDGPTYRLSSISVSDKLSGNQKMNFILSHSYFGTAADRNQRLRLDTVIVNNSGEPDQKYSFAYNSLPLPPYPYNTTPIGMFNEDFWGYYNNSNRPSLIAYQFLRQNEWQGYQGNRDAEDVLSKACMLEEIHYPAGGKSVFEFERHSDGNNYYYPRVNSIRGGFRVKSIKSYSDEGNLAFQKNYTYESPVSDEMNIETFQDFFSYIQPYYTAIPSFEPTSCSPPNFYKKVVRSSPIRPFQPVMYQKVTEYTGTEVQNIGKTVYEYEVPIINPANEGHNSAFLLPVYLSPYHYDKGDANPRLTTTTIYKNTNGTYKPVRDETNTYTAFRSAQVFNSGVHVVKTLTYIMNGLTGAPTPGWEVVVDLTSSNSSWWTYPEISSYLTTLKYFDTKAYEEAFLLTQTSTHEYDDNENPTFTSSKSYTYNPDLFLPIEQTTLNSKGDTLRTETKYPSDFSSLSPYNTMVARNILTPAIEQRQYKNSQFLQSVKTNYAVWSTPDIIQPQSVETAKGNTSPEVRIRYHEYDAFGNPKTVSKENGVKYTYLYDYRQTLPIAQVTNAVVGDIAYTSFEADSKGGWTFSGAISGPAAQTGNKYYDMIFSVDAITKSGLNPSMIYTLSYWSKGVLQVTGGTQTDLQSTEGTNGWWLYSMKITGATSITIQGAAPVDEIRLHPFNAQMTTYTYDPLIGITSVTDPNNVTMYYEYDTANRLKAIRDSRGNVLKTYTYHYKGQ